MTDAMRNALDELEAYGQILEGLYDSPFKNDESLMMLYTGIRRTRKAIEQEVSNAE